AAATARHWKCADPLRREAGDIFVPIRLTPHAIGESLQGYRSVAQMGQQIGGHPHVIIDDVRLGESRRRIQQFLRTRDPYLAPVDLENLSGCTWILGAAASGGHYC